MRFFYAFQEALFTSRLKSDVCFEIFFDISVMWGKRTETFGSRSFKFLQKWKCAGGQHEKLEVSVKIEVVDVTPISKYMWQIWNVLKN